MENLAKLQEKMDSTLEDYTFGENRVEFNGGYQIRWKVTHEDVGFQVLNRMGYEFIFGACTDGNSVTVYPDGILSPDLRKQFASWMKGWRKRALEKHGEMMDKILEGVV